MIDPHIHQWDPFTTPREQSRMARLFRPFPRVPKWMQVLAPKIDREFVGDPNHAIKPYLPANYQADAGVLPVTKVVHIEAAWASEEPMGFVEETRWVAALPFGQDGRPELAGIVVKGDPRWPDLGAVLDGHLEASPLVRGVRHSLANHPDPQVRGFEDDPRAVVDDRFVDGFRAIAERGMTFELWMLAHQLPDAVRLVREYPETTFVLDHYATPVGIFGPRGKHTARTEQERADILARWRDDVSAIAAHPNVVAKHSGLGMPLLGPIPDQPYARHSMGAITEQAGPLIQHLHDVFGPERSMWASNFPMDRPVLEMPASAQILLDVLGADADPQRMFHDVAARTYRI